MKRVKDYEVDFSNGLFNCCMDHILGCEDQAYENMVITCDECGQAMILKKVNGVLMWRKN